MSQAYRVQHTAPDRHYGAPMHDLNEGGIYPCDVYARPQHYFDERPASRSDRESWAVIAKVRCQPNALVTVYRAVPPGIRVINPGDWVTPSRVYAKQHALDLLGPGADGVVISMRVPARTLFTDGNSLSEWGYDP